MLGRRLTNRQTERDGRTRGDDVTDAFPRSALRHDPWRRAGIEYLKRAGLALIGMSAQHRFVADHHGDFVHILSKLNGRVTVAISVQFTREHLLDMGAATEGLFAKAPQRHRAILCCSE